MLLPGERVAACLRYRIASLVDALQIPGRVMGALGGLQTCGSVWMCASCASKISERRREELQQAIDQVRDAGGSVVMVTYTLRHHNRESLGAVRGGLQVARQVMCRSRAYRAVMGELDLLGKVHALEVTHGVNGWHPHIHELLMISGGFVDLISLETQLRVLWLRSLKQQEMSGDHHALRVQLANGDVGDYVAKFDGSAMWTAAHELTKQTVKEGRASGSRSPMALLRDYLEGDENAGVLWREYALEFKGRRQLVWSDGLRARLGLVVEKSDAEVAAEVREDAVLVTQLVPDEWRTVLANDARLEVMVLAGAGDGDAIHELVARLRE